MNRKILSVAVALAVLGGTASFSTYAADPAPTSGPTSMPQPGGAGGEAPKPQPPQPGGAGGETPKPQPPQPGGAGGETPKPQPPQPGDAGGEAPKPQPPKPGDAGGEAPKPQPPQPGDAGGEAPKPQPPQPGDAGGEAPKPQPPQPGDAGGEAPKPQPPQPGDAGGETPKPQPPQPGDAGGETPKPQPLQPGEAGGETPKPQPPKPGDAGGEAPKPQPPKPGDAGGEAPKPQPPKPGDAGGETSKPQPSKPNGGEKPAPGKPSKPDMKPGKRPMPLDRPNEKLKKLGVDPDELPDFDEGRLEKMTPEQVAALRDDEMEMIPPDAMRGFDKEKAGRLDHKAGRKLSPEQMKNVPKEAMPGFKAPVLAKLSGETIQNMLPDQLAEIDLDEIGKMSDREKAKFLANMPTNVDDDVARRFTPPGWVIGEGNIKNERPIGAPVMLPGKMIEKVPGLDLPDIADMEKDFGLGGQPEAGCVENCTALGKLNALLGGLGVGYKARQSSEGTLSVEMNGEPEVTLSFLPEADGMEEADPNAPPLVADEKEGGRFMLSANGKHMKVRPAFKKPKDVLTMLDEMGEMDTTEDVQTTVEVDERAHVKMQFNHHGELRAVKGVPDYLVLPDEREPGVYFGGEPGSPEEYMDVVYENGTSQSCYPVVQSVEGFEKLAKSLNAKIMRFNEDGSIKVKHNHYYLTLRFGFDILPPAESMPVPEEGEMLEPALGPDEDGNLLFIDETGNRQPVYVDPDSIEPAEEDDMEEMDGMDEDMEGMDDI